MKLLVNITLLLLNLNNTACSQSSNLNPILGEWMLKTDYEAPDLIIFRSDNKYFVYNDMDFIGISNTKFDCDIILDNGRATALTETGVWNYELTANKITLKDRNFIKETSEFNKYYGKGKELVFTVQEISNDVLVICPGSNDKACDTYIKNANLAKTEGKIYYREITEDYSSHGQQKMTIELSGYERHLIINYEFFKVPDELIVEDRNGKVLFSTKMISTKETQIGEILLQGITQLVFRVNCSKPESKWKYSVEIK
jgi:hypothetical protein